MLNKSIDELKEDLKSILVDFEIPNLRKQIFTDANINWLSRNLAFKNVKHPKFEEARMIIRLILLKKDKE